MMEPVDVALILAAGASLPIYSANLGRRVRSYRLRRDHRAHREFTEALLWWLVALAALIVIAVVRWSGATFYDHLRLVAVTAFYSTLFFAGVILLIEGDNE